MKVFTIGFTRKSARNSSLYSRPPGLSASSTCASTTHRSWPASVTLVTFALPRFRLP